jgi:hypothetical protein
MRVTAPKVVVFWGLVNGVLVAMLAGFGEQAAAIALYGSVAALVEVIAVAVWMGIRRRQHLANPALPAWYPPNGDSVLILAAAVFVAGLGIAFYPPLALTAVPLLALFVTKEISARKGS